MNLIHNLETVRAGDWTITGKNFNMEVHTSISYIYLCNSSVILFVIINFFTDPRSPISDSRPLIRHFQVAQKTFL